MMQTQINDFVKVHTMNQEFTCEFCEKSFGRERTLINHLCEQKRRWLNRNEKYVQMGFNTWLTWHEKTSLQNNTKKTYKEFMKSKYYLAFTKFGKHIERVNLINPISFIEFVIKNSIKLDDWCNDTVYEEYVKDSIKHEDVTTVISRMIEIMEKWANETGHDWTDYFEFVNTNQAVHFIRNGRINPWIILNSTTYNKLNSRLTDEQKDMVKRVIDMNFWNLKMKRNPNDHKFVVDILKENGI